MRWSPHGRTVVVAAGASLLLGALIVYGVVRGQTKSLEIYGDAPAFKLTDQLERPVSSDEFRGKVVVANFVYTNCPDICRAPAAGLLPQRQQLYDHAVTSAS